MAMTAQGLMLSLAGVSVAPMMAFHARSKRADLIRARKVSTACPLAIRQRMPERFMRWVTRVLLAASTTPRADGDALCLQGVVAHALAVLAEEGEFPFDLGPIRLCAITKVAQRPDHLVDATGVVTQNLAVPLEPVGDHRMVGCRSEMFAGMPEVDDLGFGRQGLQEGPIVGGGVGDSDDPDVGAQLPDMCDFACELRLQCDLATLSGMRPR